MSSLSWIGIKSASGGMYAADGSLVRGLSVETMPSHCDSNFSCGVSMSSDIFDLLNSPKRPNFDVRRLIFELSVSGPIDAYFDCLLGFSSFFGRVSACC